MPQHRKRRPFPSREQIVEFVSESPREVGFREIARAFGVTGRERETLKSVVRELERDELIRPSRHRRRGEGSDLPPVGVLEVVGIDEDGDVLAKPQSWPDDRPSPRIYLVPADRRSPAPAPGDRVLARLSKVDETTYEARVMRRLEQSARDVVGIFGLARGQGRIRPTNRRIKTEFTVAPSDRLKAEPGDLVRAETLPGRRHGMPQARVVERIGRADGPGYASMIAVAENEIPMAFTREAMDLARRAGAAPMDDRVDLRDVPFVTIDGADARDFDDAVWAEADADVPGGWHLRVAIADVAWYVRPGDALDRDARERGNSVYFPDRVVPMLPEELSNGWCSLKPDEDRPCVVADIRIGPDGRIKRHRFVRAMMRSVARLTYEQVQNALDGSDRGTVPYDLIETLDGAFRTLEAAREARGTLELDLPERRIEFAEDGSVSAIGVLKSLDSHRLIEEFMIAANVAAAESLGRTNAGGLFRVHDSPAPEKFEELREILASFDIRLAKGQVLRPRLFRNIVERVLGTPLAPMVQNAVLRSQAKAIYSPDDTGHFGLALRNYAHFTSPIRRYADLEVHRALIGAFELGAGGTRPNGAELAAIAEHVSMTERRAARAERDVVDKLSAEFLSNRLDAEFDAHIVDAIRAGIFVRLDETGAEGLLPLSQAGDERFRFDSTRRAFRGTRSREWLRPGDPVRVKLIEADRMTGSLVFARVSRGK